MRFATPYPKLLGRFELRTHAGEVVAVSSRKAQAKQNLRQALVALRRALPSEGRGVLEAIRQDVAVCQDSLRDDVREFLRLAESRSRDAPKHAVTLCSGDLLEELDARALETLGTSRCEARFLPTQGRTSGQQRPQAQADDCLMTWRHAAELRKRAFIRLILF